MNAKPNRLGEFLSTYELLLIRIAVIVALAWNIIRLIVRLVE